MVPEVGTGWVLPPPSPGSLNTNHWPHAAELSLHPAELRMHWISPLHRAICAGRVGRFNHLNELLNC